ncbi:hypothetical protein PMAYCL1PPCAC_25563, partial [Pristionchus mayeri]
MKASICDRIMTLVLVRANSGAAGNANAGGDLNAEYITLKFFGEDERETHFRLKYETRMGNVKKFYANRIGVPVASLRFLHYGYIIDDEDTPRNLE